MWIRPRRRFPAGRDCTTGVIWKERERNFLCRGFTEKGRIEGVPGQTGRDGRGIVCAGEARADAGCEADGSAAVEGEARDSELLAAVGEVDRGCRKGDPSGLYAAGMSGAGGESFGTAERGVSEEGVGSGAEPEDSAEGGWGQCHVLAVAEWVAHCGFAGDGGDGARVFGGVADADR